MTGFNRILRSIGFVLISFAILLGVVLIVINKVEKNRVVQEITSTTILERISEQYFVVTKTVVLDQKVTINIDEGSKWSNFLWGQTIDAEALIRVDIGVDMSELDEEDVVIDYDAKTVTIDVPEATVLDASQFGDINVESTAGILKFLLDRDPNEDHNLSLDQLIADAQTVVEEDEALFVEAREDATKLLDLIVRDLGFSLVIAE